MITQSIRCYSPADLLLLLQGTGLVVQRWEVDGAAFDPLAQPQTMTSTLWQTWDYFVQLVPAGRAG